MVSGDFMTTYTGKKIRHGSFKVEDVCIEDIAHSLSMICRFGGHVPRHYSVGEHSLLVAQLVPDAYKLEALLHDATESYVGDMVAPLKKHNLLEGYRLVEGYTRSVIDEKFNLTANGDTSEIIHRADIRALYVEARSFYGKEAIKAWGFAPEIVKWGESSSRDVLCYAPSPHDIEKQFMNAFLAYGGVK